MGKGAGAMRPITPQQNTKMRLRMRLLAAVLAVLVSSGYLLAVGWMQTLFAPWNFPGWLLAAAVLSVALARELALTKKGVEEAWNLSFER